MRPFDGLISALEAEPQTATRVSGASGYEHHLLGVGVDHDRRRLILISPEAEARVAAMVQADIQAASPEVKVITARPHFDDPAAYASHTLPRSTDVLMWRIRRLSGITSRHAMTSIAEAVELRELDSEILRRRLCEADITAGLCPLPLYEFTDEELELLFFKPDVDATRAILTRHEIQQYFFPPPDQVVLGLIDREQLTPGW